MKRRRSLLSVAIEREDWEAAAVVLLLGLVEATRDIPPEALEEMIAELSEKQPRHVRSRKPRRAHH